MHGIIDLNTWTQFQMGVPPAFPGRPQHSVDNDLTYYQPLHFKTKQ